MIGSYWVLDWLLSEAQVSTKDIQRHGHAKPQEDQEQEGEERNRSCGSLNGHEQVEEEHHGEHDAWEHKRRSQGHQFVVRATERGVDPSGHVATEHGTEHPAVHHRRQEPASVGRGQESKRSKHQNGKRHNEQLRTRSAEDGQQRGLSGRTEHITVHQLPSGLILHIFLLLQSVVSHKVLVNSSHHDECDHGREEQPHEH
mmetsp:Transcript_5810/g.10448  ORF Transcript_5810/g.10448 Transcript_5810/m.10448 type:complete len:200 (+) Transcript_5810:438-1037(+)